HRHFFTLSPYTTLFRSPHSFLCYNINIDRNESIKKGGGKMYSSKEVEDYIISKGLNQTNQSLTNFKLQKILYYSQGFYFKEYNKPLIKEEFKMFRHGVAIKEELERYWEFNFIEIDKTGNKLKDCKIKEEDKEFLDEVWNIFKNFTGK